MSEAGNGSSFFPPDAVVRRVNGEGVLLLGGGRAVLMQLAHPLVARGVAEHSDFERDPFGRLVATLNAMTTVVFGTEEQARQAAAVVRAVHERVKGDGYRANDPLLLQWVYATLIDTALEIHRRFLRPLPPADAERFYEESVAVAELLGVPRSIQPATLSGFQDYIAGMVATLEVSDQARLLARAVLHPRMPAVAGTVAQPLLLLGRQLTTGLLPRRLREGFGLGWDGRRKLALTAVQASSRQVLPRLPAVLRRAPADTFAQA